MVNILFICHGNICRSTMAEFYMKHIVNNAGLSDSIYIESSATSREEIGNDTHYGTKEKLDEMGIPYTRRKARQVTVDDYHNFDYYINNLDLKNPKPGLVEDSTFFALDVERNKMVGAINIRHKLNDYLLNYGGHIGDGVRPSERKKGYATKIIGLALKECQNLNIDKVLLVCDKDNIGSAKSIKNNGAILENEIVKDGKTIQRYWIEIK